MSDVFISYARSTAKQAQAVADGLRLLGHAVWLDDELPAHRAYTDVIEERLKAAKAVVVIWSTEAVKSHWVRAEATSALEAGTLVQLTVDGVMPPMPFGQIQCADLSGWAGDANAPGWQKIATSVADLVGGAAATAAPVAEAPLELPSKPSIAVLPFANRSGDPEQDYFADGMVEEIVAALSRFKSLFVIGSGSSLSFKGKATTPQGAAHALGVRYILEGSVRRAGGRVRIAVELIDATNGEQIWADRFEDTLEDVFALQDKVALSVAGVIAPAVREADLRRASGRVTENMNSYDLCLRGQSLHRSVAKADILAALDLFNGAIALDPNYGWAIALAMSCHAFIFLFGWSDDLESHRRAANGLGQRAVAVARDDPDAMAYVSNGMMMIGGDIEAAKTLADRALALNPGSYIVWGSSGWVRVSSGEPELAIEQFETSLRLDPLSQEQHFNLTGIAIARIALGQFAAAVPFLKQSAQLQPGWAFSDLLLASCYGHLGSMSAAREAIARYRVGSAVTMRDVLAAWRAPESLKTLVVEGVAIAEAGEDR
jgi:TolB-like protein/Tfp pilus assembly protein PilF